MMKETLIQAGKPITRYTSILNKVELKEVLNDILSSAKPNRRLVIEVKQK